MIPLLADRVVGAVVRGSLRRSGLFIVGTDTGVGKTRITGAIARTLSLEGVDVGVMKPVETGCRIRRGLLYPADGADLKTAARTSDPLEWITPCRYASPLAPHAAALWEKRDAVNLDQVIAAFQYLHRRHAVTLVEGIGGLLVPLAARHDLLDLVLALQLPVLLVAHSGLGTLNATLLTLRYGASRGVKFVGVILNQTTPRRTLSDRTNPAILAERCALPVLSFPFIPSRLDASPEVQIARTCARMRRHRTWLKTHLGL